MNCEHLVPNQEQVKSKCFIWCRLGARKYPGKASVIFWTNDPELRLDNDGTASLTKDSNAGPHYVEAELNSPTYRLRPGEACDFETEWFPTRAGDEFHGATDAGIPIHPLRAIHLGNGEIKASGSFGVFFSGRLVAHFYNEHGATIGTMPLADVNPAEVVSLETEIGSTRLCLCFSSEARKTSSALRRKRPSVENAQNPA
jgi:hypothetical protein